MKVIMLIFGLVFYSGYQAFAHLESDSLFTYQAYFHQTDEGVDLDITLEEVPSTATSIYILLGDSPDMSNILALRVDLNSESTSEKYIITRLPNSIQIKILNVPEELFHTLHYTMSDNSMHKLIPR